MSVLMSIEGEQVLLVPIYRPPVANQREIRRFIEELTTQFEKFHVDEYNTIVSGDLNLDRMPDIDLLNNILTRFAFTQRPNYYTHIYGGILDLVFHNRKQTPVEWLPSPYSDHFVLLIDV